MPSLVCSPGRGQQLPPHHAMGTGRPRYRGAQVEGLLGPLCQGQPLRGGSPAPLGMIHFPYFF